ncbi:MAG: cytochrome c3 family protein [Parvularculaceae bacterium]
MLQSKLSRLAFLPAGFFLLTIPGATLAQGISGSAHDLATGVGDNNEICVYCHTPHGARTDIEAPLWNKPAGTASYTTYDSTTIDGDVLAVGSVSIACLSCHDGTQARDAVINAPGSGLGTSPLGTLGPMPGTVVANLSEDLTNDHPIGIQYGGFDPGTGQVDPDFKNTTNGLNSATILGRLRWWVDTEAPGNGTRNKTDMILYTRDNGGSDQPFVECASCHDPHRGTGTDPAFMRISNTGSAVCLSCHVK